MSTRYGGLSCGCTRPAAVAAAAAVARVSLRRASALKAAIVLAFTCAGRGATPGQAQNMNYYSNSSFAMSAKLFKVLI